MFQFNKILMRLFLFSCFSLLLGTIATQAHALPNWPIVQRGDNGANVTTIQYLLRHHGQTLSVDGDFGPTTESKVKSFQQANGLVADGIVGTNSWGALIVTLNYGDQNNAVRALQTQLNKHGHNLVVDGIFGNGTNTAVLAFKQDNYLGGGSTVGPTTWQVLTGSGSGNYALLIPQSTLPRSEYDDDHHDYPAIDLPTASWTPAYALHSGTISYVGGSCGYGILITGDDGATYKYCHLNSRSVSSGSRVAAGQLIGYTGNTGHSSGPHLHLELRYNGSLRCPQTFLTAIYDGNSPPHPSTLPTYGCTY